MKLIFFFVVARKLHQFGKNKKILYISKNMELRFLIINKLGKINWTLNLGRNREPNLPILETLMRCTENSFH